MLLLEGVEVMTVPPARARAPTPALLPMIAAPPPVRRALIKVDAIGNIRKRVKRSAGLTRSELNTRFFKN